MIKQFLLTPISIMILTSCLQEEAAPIGASFEVTMAENSQTQFTKDSHPHFVLMRTTNGRRDTIRIKQYVQTGTQSYIIAD